MFKVQALINSDMEKLLSHHLLATDGHDHFKAHLETLPEYHPGKVQYDRSRSSQAARNMYKTPLPPLKALKEKGQRELKDFNPHRFEMQRPQNRTPDIHGISHPSSYEQQDRNQ